jgi:hypothetical protein
VADLAVMSSSSVRRHRTLDATASGEISGPFFALRFWFSSMPRHRISLPRGWLAAAVGEKTCEFSRRVLETAPNRHLLVGPNIRIVRVSDKEPLDSKLLDAQKAHLSGWEEPRFPGWAFWPGFLFKKH